MNVTQLKDILSSGDNTTLELVGEGVWEFSIDKTPLGEVVQDGNNFYVQWRKYGFGSITSYFFNKETHQWEDTGDVDEFWYTGFLGCDTPIMELDRTSVKGELNGVYPRRYSSVIVEWSGVEGERGEWNWDTHDWGESMETVIFNCKGKLPYDKHPELW